MGNKNTSNGAGGIGLSTVLTLIFVVLKLVGVIDWSWVWVLSPTWISLILWLVAVLGIAIYLWCDSKELRESSNKESKKGKDKWKF